MYKDENHYTLCLKDGRNWGYYWYDENNKRHFRSTGRKTKHEALKVVNERIRKGELALKDEKRKSDILFKDYASNCFIEGKCPILKERERTGHGLSITTIYNYRKSLMSHLMPFFGEFTIENIDDNLIRSFQDDQLAKGIAHKTINQRTFPLRTILDHAVREHRIDRNPFELMDRMKEEDSNRKAFTLEQVTAILGGNWKSEISRIAFKLACLTGMRMGEVQAMKPRCFKDGMIEISENFSPYFNVVKCTKNGKTRYVPYPEEMRDELEWLSRNRNPDQFIFSVNGDIPFSRQTIRNDMKDRMKEEGINDPDLTFHSTRHFFDSYLYLKAGVEKEKIMKVIGHQSEDMFRHYLHVENEDLKEVREAQKTILSTEKK